jgi:hypothetical protein
LRSRFQNILTNNISRFQDFSSKTKPRFQDLKSALYSVLYFFKRKSEAAITQTSNKGRAIAALSNA